ncbi:MAG: pyrimidine/purine nucleoside phosphorylase [Trichloromonadaceae bacterium]
MSAIIPQQFDNVTVASKANIYFDGKVVSHTLTLANGQKKTLGLIYPGSFRFNTDQPERMDIVAGNCQVRLEGASDWTPYAAGSGFDVPAGSAFDIAVTEGITEYICSFG